MHELSSPAGGSASCGVLLEVTVDRRPRGPEGLRDLLNAVLSRLIHGSSLLDLRWGHFELRPALPTTSTGSGQPITGPFNNQVVLKLRNGHQHMEEQPATGGGGIDPLGQGHQSDTLVLQLVSDILEVTHRAT